MIAAVKNLCLAELGWGESYLCLKYQILAVLTLFSRFS